MLDRERAFYASHVDEWAKVKAGLFIAIKGEEVLGTFNSQNEALFASVARFGSEPVLIRRVGDKEATVSIPALTLGLLRASS
jgi:hypothetical protein